MAGVTASGQSAWPGAVESLLPDPGHPNFLRWRAYHKSASWRGAMVQSMLGPLLPPHAVVLDIGCGTGGTSIALAAKGAMVLAVEVDRARLEATRALAGAAGVPVRLVLADGCTLPCADQSCHAVVLQDVLEHVSAPERLVREAARALKPGGVAFVSTPNRWSPLNALSDPHWGLPGVAMLPRKVVGRCTKARRGAAALPAPALLSLRRLRWLMRMAGLDMSFANRDAARFIAAEPRAALCAPFHLRIAAWAKRRGLLKFLPAMVNDRLGLFNCWVNPNWYILAKKR
ncbi:MAG: class I SAM-dependent methyltransferase [Calditrichaeota bacterium]|nr:class I SAM-dependent methyltransferase [Calditrichota bacterium]